MYKYRALSFAALVSLLYNFVLLGSVVLDMPWTRNRAAGGQYIHFPIGIRAIYFVMAIAMLFLMGLIWNHRVKPVNSFGVKLTRVLMVVFILSTIAQLISRSTTERWNAIPAAILAITFGLISRTSRRNVLA